MRYVLDGRTSDERFHQLRVLERTIENHPDLSIGIRYAILWGEGDDKPRWYVYRTTNTWAARSIMKES